MQVLVNTTTLVYLYQTRPALAGRLGIATIRDVAVELGHMLGDSEAKELLQGVEVTGVRKARLASAQGKWLSETDVRLLGTAKALNAVLVTDDKKLMAAAKENGVDSEDTPHFIESLGGKLRKEEALDLLDRLAPLYLRRKVIERARERIERW